MRHLLIAVALALPLAAAAQQASKGETSAVQSIVECLVQGLPEDWQSAEMTVELPKPLAESGEVRYTVMREGGDKPEDFTPCDIRKPARTLIESRKRQEARRRGWTSAKLVLQRDGSFSLNYQYPKAAPKTK
jgi:hypothetical protein